MQQVDLADAYRRFVLGFLDMPKHLRVVVDASKGVAWTGSVFGQSIPSSYFLDYQGQTVTKLAAEIVPLAPPLISLRGNKAIIAGLGGSGNSAYKGRPELFEVDTETGSIKQLTRLSETGVPRPLFLESQGLLLYSFTPDSESLGQQLRMLDVNGDRSRQLIRTGTGSRIFQASLSPDKKEAAYIVCSQECQLSVMDLGAVNRRDLGSFSSPEGDIGFLLPPVISWVASSLDAT